MTSNQFYEVFQEGCCVKLTSVIESDYSLWVKWLLAPSLTSNLQSTTERDSHNISSQKIYVKTQEDKGRIFFVARDLNDNPLGILTLTDFTNAGAHFTIFFGGHIRSKPFVSIEATALLVTYAFSKFEIKRLEGGSRLNGLKGWVNRLTSIGFLPDGMQEDGWVKEMLVEPTVRFSITRSYFEELCDRRGGGLWPSDAYISNVINSIRRLTSASFTYISDQYIESLTELRKNHKLLLSNAEKYEK